MNKYQYSRQSREAEVSETNGTYSICITAGFSGGVKHAMSKTFGPATSQPHFFSSKCCSASRPEMARARKEGSFSHLMLAFVHSWLFAHPNIRCLRNLLSYLKVAIFQPELPEYTSRTKFALKSCDFRARAARVHFACYFRTQKLRFSSRSCQSTLRVLLSYLKAASPSYQSTLRALLSCSKIAICKPELAECISRTTFVLKSCDFPAGAARVHFAHYFRT